MARLANFEYRLEQLQKDIDDLKPKRLGNCYGGVALLDAVGGSECNVSTSYALSAGNFSDGGLQQTWRESISSTQDVEE